MNTLRVAQAAFKSKQWTMAFCLPGHNMTQNVRTKTTSATAKKSRSESTDIDEPIQYFGSQAASWRAKDTRSGGADEHLWYQPYVISGSLLVFLLYFCVFREENDIDLKLVGNLYDHVQGLEEVQLTLNYKQNKAKGLDNSAIIKRLNELGIDVNVLEATNE